jgi:hypothetical protein
MVLSELLAYFLLGRLMIFIIQKFPFQKLIPRLFDEGKFLEELFSCDLCLGCYVFWFLAWILEIDFVYQLFGLQNATLLNYMFTGIIASFITHVFRIGWTTKFGITFLEQ